MQVILKEVVGKLDKIGRVINVAPGYARNFLLPQGKAVRATDANKKVVAAHLQELEAKAAAEKQAAEVRKASLIQLGALTITHAANEDGSLFGSVSAKEIKEAIVALGGEVSSKEIDLSGAIKTTGEHHFKVILHPEVAADLKITVIATEDL